MVQVQKLCVLVQMGFFADAGPLQIFVSQHLIPSHYRIEITDDAAFESEENAPPIKAGAFVRVRLVGLKAEANQLVSISGHTVCLLFLDFEHGKFLTDVMLKYTSPYMSPAVLCGDHH